MKRKASISHDEAIIRRLRKEPDFAAEYLKAALEDEDEPRVLLIALCRLAQAQGIAKVAKAARIERESLYRALSVHGNPRLSTLAHIIHERRVSDLFFCFCGQTRRHVTKRRFSQPDSLILQPLARREGTVQSPPASPRHQILLLRQGACRSSSN